ncbi:unnamed protein product [Toxocara canis]|uniref:G_PROTEIN_RECEP_F1_2 domain-containing protein n=1 Tax=Toxocara canis TaxID=6265 RepID=A0A183UBF2_TOXCA|nr:unnamed protein product [Toxocara canis]
MHNGGGCLILFKRSMHSISISTLITYIRVPVAMITLIGNGVGVFVILKYRTLRTSSSSLLIAQLGFCDFILGVGLMIRTVQATIATLSKTVFFMVWRCLLYDSIDVLAMHLIQTTTFIIALDRFIVIVFPLTYRRMVSVKVFHGCQDGQFTT